MSRAEQLSRVRLFATLLRTVASQAALCMGCSRQEYQAGWLFPPPPLRAYTAFLHLFSGWALGLFLCRTVSLCPLVSRSPCGRAFLFAPSVCLGVGLQGHVVTLLLTFGGLQPLLRQRRRLQTLSTRGAPPARQQSARAFPFKIGGDAGRRLPVMVRDAEPLLRLLAICASLEKCLCRPFASVWIGFFVP